MNKLSMILNRIESAFAKDTSVLYDHIDSIGEGFKRNISDIFFELRSRESGHIFNFLPLFFSNNHLYNMRKGYIQNTYLQY